jgi:hypothetical protein
MAVAMSEIDPDALALTRRLIAEQGIEPGALMVPRADVDALVALAAIHGARLISAKVLNFRFCRVCGCTETASCRPEPCWWASRDLCSACAPFVGAAA